VDVLFLGGGTALVGVVVGLALATTNRRLLALVCIGAAAALVLLIASYLSATPSSEPPDCHDCIEFLDRWWEPGLVVVWLAFNLIGWAGGLVAGAFFRGTFNAPRKTLD
jgi:hypothetical protein